MRYLPLTEADRRSMLGRIGVPSVESLYRDVPEFARLTAPVDLPAHLGDAGQHVRQLAARDGAVHAVVVRRDAADRREGRLAAGPERQAFGIIR